MRCGRRWCGKIAAKSSHPVPATETASLDPAYGPTEPDQAEAWRSVRARLGAHKSVTVPPWKSVPLARCRIPGSSAQLKFGATRCGSGHHSTGSFTGSGPVNSCGSNTEEGSAKPLSAGSIPARASTRDHHCPASAAERPIPAITRSANGSFLRAAFHPLPGSQVYTHGKLGSENGYSDWNSSTKAEPASCWPPLV